MRFEIPKGYIAALLAAPLALVLLVDKIPPFVFASCSYYVTCDPQSFSVSAYPDRIAVNETTALEGFYGECPCSWQIDSQPGGWEVVAGSNCTATLKPTGAYGQAGTVVVRCDSGQTCSETVSVEVGGSTFRVEASANGGSSWTGDEGTIYGKPGEYVDLALRVSMTVTNDLSEGWSYSMKHDTDAIVSGGGALDLLSVTTEGTHTATVQDGLVPDFEVTEIRDDAAATVLGFIQGVVIDDGSTETDVSLDPVLNFVTAGSCYRLTMPSQGSYEATFFLTDDIGDGRPPIRSVITQRGGSTYPHLRSFTLKVYSHSSYSTPPGDCDPTWITSGDGIPGPALPDGGGAGGPVGGSPTLPPVSVGDADDNGRVEITDAIFLFRSLFLGGPLPATIPATPHVLRTGQTTCFDTFQIQPCTMFTPAGALFGQDAHYATSPTMPIGAPKSLVARDPNGDGTSDVVDDLRTGLMWQARPNVNNTQPDGMGGTTTAFTLAEAVAQINSLNSMTDGGGAVVGFENSTDWRLPTIRELLSIVDYSGGVSVPGGTKKVSPLFVWDGEEDSVWSSDAYGPAPAGTAQWILSVDFGLTSIGDPITRAAGIVAVRTRKGPVPHAGPEVADGTPFTLGDFDLDGALVITDPINILSFLFQGGSPPPVYNGPLPVSAPGPFTVKVVGLRSTVLDNTTGLTWHGTPPGFRDLGGNEPPPLDGLLDWPNALLRAETDDLDGQTDWRLPNAFEIATLVDYTVTAGPALDTSAFDAFTEAECFPADPQQAVPQGCNTPYWTSTTGLSGGGFDPERATQMYPHETFDPVLLLMNGQAGSIRHDSPSAADFGDKDADPFGGWVLPVRGPGP